MRNNRNRKQTKTVCQLLCSFFFFFFRKNFHCIIRHCFSRKRASTNHSAALCYCNFSGTGAGIQFPGNFFCLGKKLIFGSCNHFKNRNVLPCLFLTKILPESSFQNRSCAFVKAQRRTTGMLAHFLYVFLFPTIIPAEGRPEAYPRKSRPHPLLFGGFRLL